MFFFENLLGKLISSKSPMSPETLTLLGPVEVNNMIGC